jgi:hypothetical protein
LQGADTLIWLAASPAVSGLTGLFWLDRRIHTTDVFPGTATPPTQQAVLAERLDQLLLRFEPQQAPAATQNCA